MNAHGCVGALTPLAPNTTPLPDEVLFQSRGAVLVIGDDADIADAVHAVARHHRTTAFAPGIDAIRFGPRVTTVGSRVSALRGRLGAFRGELRGPDGPKDIGASSPNRDGLFDLVLDLGRQPLLSSEIAPLGYFAVGQDPAARAEALAKMATLIGSFTKPRYFQYQADLCAHGASSLTGCTRCLDVCSTAAIASVGNQIRVDPYLCQGCASCTLACPTGALSFRLPARDDLRARLVATLQKASPSSKPVLVVHGSEDMVSVKEAAVSNDALLLVADPLPAFGEELWLEAFALGAVAMSIVEGECLAPKARALIEARVAQARVMLQSLGIAAHRLAFLRVAELAGWLSRAAGVTADGADHSMIRRTASSPAIPASTWKTKRLAQLDSITRLGDVAPPRPVALPLGACFGEVIVDRDRCTLCFACVNLCPTGALSSHEGQALQLTFAEDACVQCGLCERGCPESAVSLRPRFIPETEARGSTRVLNEDGLWACTACATPFISRKLLTSSLERIKGHPVLAKGGRELLMLCPACRQGALLET